MKISKVISRVNDLKPNDYDECNKIGWLSELDAQIKTEIIDTYEGAEQCTFKGYDSETSKEIELLAYAPYDEMYIHYLQAKIDYYNGEFNKYNANISMFNTVFDNFQAHYARTHRTKGISKITYF